MAPFRRSRIALLSLSLSLSLVLLGGCASTPPSIAEPSAPAAQAATTESVADFFAQFTDDWMRRQPSSASASRYFDGPEQAELDRQITPQTALFRADTVALAQAGLSRLAAFDRAAMNDEQRVSAELLRWQLQTIVDGARYEHLQFPLQQFSGANVGLPNLLTVIHPLRTEQDADSYLARLQLFDERMGEAVQEARERAARGILPPRFILQATIDQMQKFVASDASGNPLVTTLANKLGALQELDPARRQALLDAAQKVVRESVYPAWRAAIAELEAQLPKSTDDAGLWRFPDGAQAYAQRLNQFTSTDLDAGQIHQIGLREVARIEAEMDRVLRSIGRTAGSVRERIEKLQVDLAYPNNDDGRSRIMADIETMIRDAERRAATLFDAKPKSPVIARPYPEFLWASAAAGYTAPPLDGSRPGLYQMPLRPDQLTRFGLRTLVYHETVPGHHFQNALMVENQALPKFRQTRAFGGISAFGEGWALYAERLAVEENWYEGDPEGLLGQLEAELFRARRLVVDTGLHAKHWTRQQAIDYGISPSEVDRYVVMPGQATSYKIGQLEIIRLRDQARTELGERFDPKQFHNRVLLTGTVPLTLLAREVEAFVRSSTVKDR